MIVVIQHHKKKVKWCIETWKVKKKDRIERRKGIETRGERKQRRKREKYLRMMCGWWWKKGTGRKKERVRHFHIDRSNHSGAKSGSTSSQTGEWSNNSINCWSIFRDLGNAYLRYSSKIAVDDQCCNFRKHPTKHPVRCFPLLQWISIGWFRTSKTWRRANLILSSGIYFQVWQIELIWSHYFRNV